MPRGIPCANSGAVLVLVMESGGSLADGGPALEEEIKLGVASDARLEAVLADVGRRVVALDGLLDRSYVDEYLDLPDQALLHQGLALRLRTQGRERWVELKGAGTASAGVARRLEWRQSLPLSENVVLCRDLADGPVGRHVLTLVPEEAPLVALFTCDILRRCLSIAISDHCRAEIAFDRGEVRTARRRVAIREVEVERLAGPWPPVAAFAEDLARRHDLVLADHSKFSLGLSLLGWKIAGWT